MRSKALLLILILGLAALLTGCGYEKKITRTETPGAKLTAPDPARYGNLRVVWVREYRKPVGLSRFPDGGKARDVAVYAILYQSGGGQEREVGRIELEPVRPGDFGNLGRDTFEWTAPDRLSYRKEYGYEGRLKRVAEGELQIPPLP